jgi:prepilin-type N-terminal cleavage/methylation domain-containing protein
MRQRQARTRAGGGRPGFTLIEMLVVITIIALLLTLSAAAILRFTGVGQRNATQAQLTKLATLLRDRWNIALEIARKEPIPTTPVNVVSWIDTNFGTTTNTPLRRVIYIKLKLRQEFPMTFDEALNLTATSPLPSPLPALPVYQQYLTNLGIAGSSAQTAPYESAACLAMILQRGSSGAGFTPEDLGVGAAVNFPNGASSIPALVDGWGSPLAFVRSPAGDPVLNPGGARSGPSNDTTDPTGLLCVPTWLASTVPVTGGGTVAVTTNFDTVFGYTPPSTSPATSYYLPPLIVSPGPDKILGLDTTATPTSTAADDNLSTATPPP